MGNQMNKDNYHDDKREKTNTEALGGPLALHDHCGLEDRAEHIPGQVCRVEDKDTSLGVKEDSLPIITCFGDGE